MEWKSTLPHASNGRAIITATAIGEESFIDSIDDGEYTEGEVFTDTNGDSKYTGYLCPVSGDGDYCVRELITITKSIQIVIGGSEFSCDFKDATGTFISNVDLTTATGSESVTFTVSVYDDTYSNTPPAGTGISSSIENGEIAGDTDSWTVTDSLNSTYDFDVTLKRETTENGVLTGNATFLVTSPNGIISTCSIPVSDDA
ncbi:hypothetical protein ACLKMH_02100 [Psychromonas sp. KJ10-10]|uniref:hypothetical protein n=1 Tax=Psychromonas sp. KJ10-10 TaxID=3391823 RepID=UPI0039B458AE